MSLITELSGIPEAGRRESAEAAAVVYTTAEMIGDGENCITEGDNLPYMKYLMENGGAGTVKLIYIDPPFFSKSSYEAVIKAGDEDIRLAAYHDRWQDGMGAYLRMLSSRIFLMRELLSEDGSFWIHLDWHVVHYVKILLDEIFGEKCFVNEIIWHYKSGGTSKKHFSRKHDTLLFYCKDPAKHFFHVQTEKSYNRGFKPYRFKGVKEYKDELGWYTMVNMKDVWSIDMVGRTSTERTGYATQKPEALLARIVESCTAPGDLCADFFGGSATMCAAAQKAGRRWLCCDSGAYAISSAYKRMSGIGGSFRLLTEGVCKNPPKIRVRAEIRQLVLSDKRMLEIELLSCRTDLKKLPVKEADVEKLRHLGKADPLAMVDYWSIDFNYDGIVHRPTVAFSRRDGRLESCSSRIGDRFGTLSVRVTDIFGNSIRKTLETEPSE